LLIQPLFAREHSFSEPLSRLLTAREGDFDREIRIIEADAGESEHSWYPDIVIGASGERDILLVIPLETLSGTFLEELHNLPSSVEILIVAPRTGRDAAAGVVRTVSDPDNQTAVVYRLPGEPSQWRLSVEGRVTPVWLAGAAIRSGALPASIAMVNTARLGLGRREPVLESALDDGQSALALQLNTDSDLPTVLTDLAGAIDSGPGRNERPVEQNYLIFPFTFGDLPTLVITEGTLIWSIVVLATLMVLYAVSRPRRIKRYVSAIGHNVVLFLAIFLLLVAILIMGNMVIRLLGSRFPLSGIALPLTVAKYSLGLTVFTLLHPLLHGRLRRGSTVYSGAALLLLMIGSIIASLFSLILGAFFIVAFLFGFFFSLSHNGLLKFFFLLLAFLPGSYLLVTVASVADLETIRTLLIPSLWREVVTAVLLLPLVLMFFRLDILVQKIPVLPIAGMIAGVVTAIAVATAIHTLGETDASFVRIQERYPREMDDMPGSVPEEGILTLTGVIGSGEIQVRRDNETLLRCEAPPCSVVLPAGPPPVQLQVETGRALDRHTIAYEVTFLEPASAVNVILLADSPVQLYAATLPGQIPPGDTGRSIEFRPGPFPPAGISETVVLRNVPERSRITLLVRARFGGVRSEIRYTGTADNLVISEYSREWTVRSERDLP
jgi:hypothetical protein